MTRHRAGGPQAASSDPAVKLDPPRRAGPAVAEGAPSGSSGGSGVRRLAWWGLFVLVGALLWVAYLRVSRTVPVNSDGASQALQAWDILHGNVLLRGWWLSDVSFYTTELPEYMLVELARGLNADVMHVSASLSYALVVLMAALLAKGRATGRAAAARMLMAAGIVLAPQLGDGADVLLLNPDHVGTTVVMLAILVVLDRADPGGAARQDSLARRARPWVPPLIGLLLAWVLVADSIVLYIGVIPLVVACGVRAFQEVVVRRRPVAAAWFELSVAAAAVAAVPVAVLTSVLIHAYGGYYAWSATTIIPLGKVAGNVPATIKGLAVLFGCDFTGLTPGPGVALAILHLIGAGLAAVAVVLSMWRFFRETSLVNRALTIAVLLNLAGYMIRNVEVSPLFAHDMVAVLPFSAVLAGRLLAERLTTVRLAPVMLAALLGYGLALAYDVAQPSVPAQDSQLTAWLGQHHLSYGLAGYWNASVVTLSSGAKVQVRPVCYGSRHFTMERWEARTSWYNPRLHRASFLVMGPVAHNGGFSAGGMGRLGNRDWAVCVRPTYSQVRASFGPPAHSYRVDADTVLVWNTNLLTRVGPF
jgi:hypothetical protein